MGIVGLRKVGIYGEVRVFIICRDASQVVCQAPTLAINLSMKAIKWIPYVSSYNRGGEEYGVVGICLLFVPLGIP